MLVEAVNGLEIGTLCGLDALLTQVWETGAQGMSMRMGGAVVMHYMELFQALDILHVKVTPLPPGPAADVVIGEYLHPISCEIIPIRTLIGHPERLEIYARSMPEGWR